MSDLQKALDDYLKLRRSLGFALDKDERTLRKFLAFLEAEGAQWITIDLARRWASNNPNVQKADAACKLRMISLFAKYRSCTDPRTEVPPQGLLPHRPQRAKPYIYSLDQVADIVEAARNLPPQDGLRAWSVATVIGLLAVTGLRISEALALDREYVDLEQAVLCVRQTKFGKTRLVPLHPSTCAALRDYAVRRDRILPRPGVPSFFVSRQGRRLSRDIVYRAFVVVSRQVGLRGPEDRRGPRLHDFRHAFAVRTLIRWYMQGRSVECELPKLSTYLGHVHWADTYWYLTSVPELMQLACDRLEKALGDRHED